MGQSLKDIYIRWQLSTNLVVEHGEKSNINLVFEIHVRKVSSNLVIVERHNFKVEKEVGDNSREIIVAQINSPETKVDIGVHGDCSVQIVVVEIKSL